MTKILFLVLFSMLVGCGEEQNQQVDIQCKEGSVYNTKIEKCVVDICQDTEILEDGYTCVDGCMIYEKDRDYYIFCEKESE